MEDWSRIPDALKQSNVRTAVILGSGLGEVAGIMPNARTFSTSEIEGLPPIRIEGHEGNLLLGEVEGKPVLLVQGRVHLYEGWSAREVTAMVRFLRKLGVENLILTNAAGVIRDRFCPGRWMMIEDHLNLTGTSPLIGAGRFEDMSEIYDPVWRENGRFEAEKLGIESFEGIYAAVIGPQYETPAEVCYLKAIGADAVGMSTALEAIEARAEGMQVLGLSCLTNWAAGLGAGKLNHEEVLEGARSAAEDLKKWLPRLLP